jgi:DNA-3-methyladenine glycosylase II
MNQNELLHAKLPIEAWTDHTDFIQVIPPQPFSFAANFGYLARSSNECMFQIQDGAIVRLIPVENDYVLAAVTEGVDGSVKIEFPASAAPPQQSVRRLAASYVWDWFDLAADLDPFYDMGGRDPLLKSVIQRFYGLRNIGIADLFEALSWGIMGQQINLAFAYTLKRRFVESFGQHVEWNGSKYWLFPVPEVVAELSITDLTPLQLTVKKAEYLIGVAKLMTEGALSKSKLLDHGDFHAAEQELTRIRGIGPWTANYVLMRCLRFPAAFPIDDVGLHNAIKHLLKLDAKPSVESIRELSSGWGEWKSYAAFYLWRTLY